MKNKRIGWTIYNVTLDTPVLREKDDTIEVYRTKEAAKREATRLSQVFSEAYTVVEVMI